MLSILIPSETLKRIFLFPCIISIMVFVAHDKYFVYYYISSFIDRSINILMHIRFFIFNTCLKISIISCFIDFWTNYCLWSVGIIVNGIRKFIPEGLCFTYLTLEVETGIHTVSDLLFVLFLRWKVFCWTGDSIFI